MRYFSKFFSNTLLILLFFAGTGQALMTASRPFGGVITNKHAKEAACAAAEQEALALTMRELAHNPSIKFAGQNDGNSAFSPPSLDAITRRLYSIRHVSIVEGDGNSIQCSVQAEPTTEDFQAKIILALAQPEMLDRYEALLQHQRYLLSQYDVLSKTLANASLTQAAANTNGTGALLQELAEVVDDLEATALYATILPEYAEGWNDLAKAYKVIQKALESSPHSPLLLAAAAEIFIRQDRPDLALEAIDSALQRHSSYAYFYDLKGVILLRKSFPILAIAAFSKAIDLSPWRSNYRMHRAAAYLIAVDKIPMCADFRQACVLGDCSGLQWARLQEDCLNDTGNTAYNATLSHMSPRKASIQQKPSPLDELNSRDIASLWPNAIRLQANITLDTRIKNIPITVTASQNSPANATITNFNEELTLVKKETLLPITNATAAAANNGTMLDTDYTPASEEKGAIATKPENSDSQKVDSEVLLEQELLWEEEKTANPVPVLD